MAKIQYGPGVRFSNSTLNIIQVANEIIEEYLLQGFDLTLRQLYYQFVARDYIANKQTEYKRLGDILNNARLAGLVDWNAIVDRTRFLRSPSYWDSPEGVIRSAAYSFKVDKWQDQKCRIEAWIEKDALVGVIESVCSKNEIPYFSCRGYVSQSEMWSAAQRIKRYYESREQKTIILHLGDHDPSGIDMTRDISERISMFLSRDFDWTPGIFGIERIALNMDQIRQYNPPPNPAKTTDSRYDSYIRIHGQESWELDALDPRTLSDLISNIVDQHIDRDKWGKHSDFESETKDTIRTIGYKFEEVRDFLREAE